jgi:tRNA (cytidine/uridine-2'-O-)-methyltransferase
MFNIVLVEPEIPANTGNIARTCAATGARLHLVKPLGFSLEDKYMKRAGLDYWEDVVFDVYDTLDELFNKFPQGDFYYATTKAKKIYSDFQYNEKNEVFFVFGKETAGLSEELLVSKKDFCVRIPMKTKMRSLNLSNSAAIILYEALRQNNFCDLSGEGSLTKFDWDT